MKYSQILFAVFCGLCAGIPAYLVSLPASNKLVALIVGSMLFTAFYLEGDMLYLFFSEADKLTDKRFKK